MDTGGAGEIWPLANPVASKAWLLKRAGKTTAAFLEYEASDGRAGKNVLGIQNVRFTLLY